MIGDDEGVLVREDSFGYYIIPSASGRRHGELIRRFTLENESRISVEVITYGATITSIKVPDKNGEVADVVLGFDNMASYQNSPYYFGSTVGRVCNRIANGSFNLGDKQHQLTLNHGIHHLHGGIKSYDKVIWDSHVEGKSILFSYTSPDMHEGYPGEVFNQITYTLTDDDELVIDFRATSTKPTPVNLTNHSYFNLAGHISGSISNHGISINADHYTPVDAMNIPTGEIKSVSDSLFDLRKPVKLEQQMDLLPNGGFDHNFCINRSDTDEKDCIEVACVTDPISGRIIDVLSTQPGLQLYTGNFLPEDDSCKGKGGCTYKKYSGLCLETQNYPNAVNQSNFPNCIIGPGDCYHHTTIYRFSTTATKQPSDENDDN